MILSKGTIGVHLPTFHPSRLTGADVDYESTWIRFELNDAIRLRNALTLDIEALEQEIARASSAEA